MISSEFMQGDQEQSHECSLSDYLCNLCGVPLTNDRVELIRFGPSPYEMICRKCAGARQSMTSAAAGWTGSANSTSRSRFHKGSWYNNPE